MVEIYKEKLMDLLVDTEQQNALQIKETPLRGVHIGGLSEEYISSVEDIMEVIEQGNNNRKVASTGMNA